MLTRGGIISTALLALLPAIMPSTSISQKGSEVPLGIGMVKPRFEQGRPLYFYALPGPGELSDEVTPFDSVTFVRNPHHTDIATAPPWFLPEMMKLDYDLLLLRAVTVSKSWIEVVVNRETGSTSWVDRHAVEFRDWPTFLLDVYAVEIIDPKKNPLRVKPLDHASVLVRPISSPLGPLAVKGDWLMVTSRGTPERDALNGWIRWRDAEKLLIRLVPLS